MLEDLDLLDNVHRVVRDHLRGINEAAARSSKRMAPGSIEFNEMFGFWFCHYGHTKPKASPDIIFASIFADD